MCVEANLNLLRHHIMSMITTTLRLHMMTTIIMRTPTSHSTRLGIGVLNVHICMHLLWYREDEYLSAIARDRLEMLEMQKSLGDVDESDNINWSEFDLGDPFQGKTST